MNLRTISINRMIMSYLLTIYCLMLPFEEVLVFSFGSILKILGIIVLAVAFIFMAANHFKMQLTWLWLFGWLLINAVSILWSQSFDWWYYFFGIYIGQTMFVFFISHLPYEYINVNLIKKGLIIGASIAALILIVSPRNSYFTSDGRRTIMFLNAKMDPNVLAIIMVIALFCILSMFNRKNNLIINIGILTILIILSIGVFLTGSRGAVISLVLSALLLASLIVREKHQKKTAFYLLIGSAIIILFLYFLLPDNLLDSRYSLTNILGLNEYDNKMHNRYTIWQFAAKLFIKKPFFGYGCGGFFSAIQSVYKKSAAHNLIVLELTELGIIGSIPFFVFLSKITINAKRHCSNIDFCMWFSILIFSLTLDSIPFKYFWVALMMICVLINLNKERRLSFD